MRPALVIVTWLIAAFLMSASCNRTEQSQPLPRPEPIPASSPAPAPKFSKPDNRPVVAVLGDSLSEGYGVDQGKSFPEIVQTRLHQDGLDVRVVNLGVSGDTTTGGLGRLPSALSLKPRILILELGGNDGLRGLPVANTKANLQTMIVQSQRAGVRVLLAGMTLPPNYGPEYIHSFEEIYKDLSRQYHVPLIPFLMEKIRDRMASTPGLMQGDGIHPTAAGHELIADTVLHYLTPLLNQ